MHTGLFGSPLDVTRSISPREEKCGSCCIHFVSVMSTVVLVCMFRFSVMFWRMRVRIRRIFDIYICIYMCMNTYMFISPVLYYKGVPPYVVVPCNRNCLLGFGYVNILNWRFEFGLPQKAGIFEPDNTRSGRLRAEAVLLDKVNFFADRAGQQGDPQEPSPELNNDVASAETELDSWQKISVDMSSVPEEQTVEDHVTTDSSDSSDAEPGWAPVVGHYTIEVPSDKKLWLNKNSKMFHMSHMEHVRVLLCGRRVGQSFIQHSGLVRYDSAKCRQCFRLKDS